MRETIQVRVMSDQRKLIERAADSLGLKASTWMRSLALEAAAKMVAVERKKSFR